MASRKEGWLPIGDESATLDFSRHRRAARTARHLSPDGAAVLVVPEFHCHGLSVPKLPRGPIDGR